MQMHDPITVNVIAEAKEMERMQMGNAVGQSESPEQSQKLDQVLGSRRERIESATGLAREFPTRVAESLNCATI